MEKKAMTFPLGEDNEGRPIYRNFTYPDSLEGLDHEIVSNTLDYLEFCAQMSDSYAETKAEWARINQYRKQQGFI